MSKHSHDKAGGEILRTHLFYDGPGGEHYADLIEWRCSCGAQWIETVSV